MHALHALHCTQVGFFKFVADKPGNLSSGGPAHAGRPCRAKRPHMHSQRCSPLSSFRENSSSRHAAYCYNCAGTLYAAKFEQASAADGGTFDISYIKLGSATQAELKVGASSTLHTEWSHHSFSHQYQYCAAECKAADVAHAPCMCLGSWLK